MFQLPKWGHSCARIPLPPLVPFSKSLPGEGKSQGIPSIFVRLGQCNLTCTWCDTKYTWLYNNTVLEKMLRNVPSEDQRAKVLTHPDTHLYSIKEELKKMSISEVIDKVCSYEGRNVVITGGEPLMQKECIVPFVEILNSRGISAEIETNGTLSPDPIPSYVQFNVSPKLSNSHNPKSERYKPQVLANILHNYPKSYLFVVGNPQDWEEVLEILKEVEIPPQRSPEELTTKSQWVVDLCLKHNVNYSHRLHLQLWGSKRGV